MSKPPASPNLLQPPPKRAPGVRRLNRLPQYAMAGAGVLVVAGFGYSLYQRHLQTIHTTQEAAAKHPEPASGDVVTNNRPPRRNSELQRVSATGHAAKPPAEQPKPATDQTGSRPTEALHEQGGKASQQEDMATQARRQAWTTYYAQLADLQRSRLDSARDSLKSDTGLDMHTHQDVGQAHGGTPPSVNPSPATMAGFSGGAQGGGLGGYPPPVHPDLFGQQEKQAFTNQAGNTGQGNDVLLAAIRPPLSPYTITAGDVIQGVVVVGEKSDTPGQFTGRVATDVRDSATGTYVLIPAQSKIVGTYDTVVTAGQTRVPTVLTSIKFPDGSTLPLGAMPGADQSGFAGLHDQVDTHLWSKIGNALLYSLPGAAIQLGVGGNNGGFGGYNAQQVAAASVAQQIGQLAQEQARAGLSIPNTATVRPGYRFVVQVTKDIVMPGPYVDRRQAAPFGVNVSLPVMP